MGDGQISRIADWCRNVSPWTAGAKAPVGRRLLSMLRSFRRPDWSLIPDRPRDAGRLVRALLGGREVISHRTAHDWTFWLHPLRRLAYNRVRRDRRAAWERQWGGDPTARRLALNEDTVTACGRALLAPDPRFFLVVRLIEEEVVHRQEHGVGREGWSVRDYTGLYDRDRGGSR